MVSLSKLKISDIYNYFSRYTLIPRIFVPLCLFFKTIENQAQFFYL